MLSVQKVEYMGEHKIKLLFSNGKSGIADLKKTIFSDTRPIFSELKDKSKFEDFKVGHDTVIWSNELDLAPEYLFFIAFQREKEFENQFKQWGYIA